MCPGHSASCRAYRDGIGHSSFGWPLAIEPTATAYLPSSHVSLCGKGCAPEVCHRHIWEGHCQVPPYETPYIHRRLEGINSSFVPAAVMISVSHAPSTYASKPRAIWGESLVRTRSASSLADRPRSLDKLRGTTSACASSFVRDANAFSKSSGPRIATPATGTRCRKHSTIPRLRASALSGRAIQHYTDVSYKVRPNPDCPSGRRLHRRFDEGHSNDPVGNSRKVDAARNRPPRID